MKNILFIGSGEIATSLIEGLVASDFPVNQILVSGPHLEKLKHLEEKLGVRIFTNNVDAIKHADTLIFAVKAQVIAQVTAECAEVIREKNPLIISLVGGTTISNLQSQLHNENLSIVRAMPNIAAKIRQSATALSANSKTTSQQIKDITALFERIGKTYWNDEKQMGTNTALVGCGVAYVFMMMEAVEKAGVKLGLSASEARDMTRQVFLGAALMEGDPEKLRHQVTTPHGVTESAIQSFEKNRLFEIFEQALKAAHDRCDELTRLKAIGF